jgi:phage-related protein
MGQVMDRFEWKPDKDVGIEIDLGVREVQFGDGVVQTQQKFLTKPRRTFTLKFTKPPKEVDKIWDFLIAHRGKRFLYIHYTGEAVKVRFSDLQRTSNGILDNLSVKFKEEYS